MDILWPAFDDREFMPYLVLLSYLGDLVASASLILGICLIFSLQKTWHFLLQWASLNALGLTLVAISKIAFIGWGVGIQSIDYTGFSGHAMRAATVFPVLGFLLAKNRTNFVQIGIVVFAIGLSLMVGYSRLLLQVHSPSEVIAGWLFGFAISAYFIYSIKHSQENFLYRPLIIFLIVPFFFFHNFGSTPTQKWLVDLSLYLSGNNQAYTRENWRF
jgi:membrane-associated phospholipid phosphatase